MAETGKEWNRSSPFTRINSPFANPHPGMYETSGLFMRVDGNAQYACGARNPKNYPEFNLKHMGEWKSTLAAAFGKEPAEIMRLLPAWVPVRGLESTEDAYELEGKLLRSYQVWTDFPYRPWHNWYDWCFLVQPDPPYQWLAGPANWHPPEAPKGRRYAVPGEVECEWDTALFGAEADLLLKDGQSRFPWPMVNDHVWIAGRWVYDCGHPGPHGMRTEIHPCRAIAFARWEGVRFTKDDSVVLSSSPCPAKLNSDEPYFVPAIQFMFFASKFGGYWFFDTLGERDYEFIVDLPQVNFVQRSYPISHDGSGRESDLALEGLRLYAKIEILPGCGDPHPIITPLFSTDSRGRLLRPTQVHVKIPMTQLKGDQYGALISLGWRDDATHTLARKVYMCEVNCDDIQLANYAYDHGDMEFRITVGCNGRWYQRDYLELDKWENRKLGWKNPWRFHLPNDESLRITTHGAELDIMDDTMRKKMRPVSMDWKAIERCTKEKTMNNGDALLKVLGVEDVDSNDPLGIADPYSHRKPLLLIPEGETQKGSLLVQFSQEIGESAELVRFPGDMAYILHYSYTVTPQKVTRHHGGPH